MVLVPSTHTIMLSSGVNAGARPFALVSIGHIRVHADTGAKASLLWVAVLSTLAVLVTFLFTTRIHEPASLVTLVVILALSVALDIARKHSRETAKMA